MKLAVLGQALSVPSQEVNPASSACEVLCTQTAPRFCHQNAPKVCASKKACWGG